MSLINIGLAVEVVKWCDELCLGWKLVNECRDHLDKVKAQSYIDKYEMKLCDATIDTETAYESVKALVNVASDTRVRQSGGVTTVVSLLELVVQAAGIAKTEGWKCSDLLEAVSRDVITFSKEMGIESRLAPTAWAPASRRGSSNSMNRTISTKTFKQVTKPSVRTVREGGGGIMLNGYNTSSNNNHMVPRRITNPSLKVEYKETKQFMKSSSRAGPTLKVSQRRNNNNNNNNRKQRIPLEARQPQPQLALQRNLKASPRSLDSNPFAITGSNGRRR